jgi:exonuclease VII small subunit
MAVTTTHPDYDYYQDAWKRLDDVLAGRDAVIRGGVDYLPMLAGHVDNPRSYRAYQQRAVFYGATGRTLEALLGAIFRKDPTFVVSSRLEQRMENFDARGNTVYTFSQKATKQVISKGRYGILVDMPSKPDLTDVSSLVPFFAGYSAHNIRSWRTREVNGIPKLDQVILQEFVQIPSEDGFGFDTVPRYRVLELDAAGMYQIRIFTQAGPDDGDYALAELIQPMPSGTRIDYIPFVFLNPGDLMPDVSKPPLVDLADVNLAMWRASADLENGRHYTAHPTPWIIGLSDTTKVEWKMGGDAIWILPEGCSTGINEFTGQGLSSLENGVNEKREQMAFLGARLLRDQKKAAETAEAQEIQQSGENATLASISRTISDGFKKALNIAEEWVSSKKEAEFELNQDFFSKRMPPQELTALVAALQAGVIPLDDVLWNLEQGEMLDPSRTLEEARELLDMDAARNAELHPDPVLVSMEQKNAELAAAAKAKPAATAGKPTMKAASPGTPVAKPKARTT